jgi:ribosome-associated translation inhibitor RaiA
LAITDHPIVSRAGHPRFFRAFTLASVKLKKQKHKEKKARKKALAPSVKEKV